MTVADDPSDGGLRPIDRTDPLATYLRELWRRRDYILAVPLNELRVQNAHTLLGNVWLVLNPTLQVGVYYVVFGLIVRADRGVEDYLAFLTIGVFVFAFCQRIVIAGARSIASSLGLIRTMRFPRAVLPLTAVVGQVIGFAAPLGVMVLVVGAHGHLPDASWLALPLVFAGTVATSAGLALLAARLNHDYRDVENTLPFVFRLAFYLSGVLYSVERLVTDEAVRGLFVLNPFYVWISLFRWALMDVPVATQIVVAAPLWAMLSLVIGFEVFRAGERSYGRPG